MPSRFGFAKLREPSEAGQHRSVRDLEKEAVKDAPGREHRGSASKAPRVLERIAAAARGTPPPLHRQPASRIVRSALDTRDITNTSPGARLPEAERIHRFVEHVGARAEALHPSLAQWVTAAKPMLASSLRCCCFTWPLVGAGWDRLIEWHNSAPGHTLEMVFGACLCVFGGPFVASLAAIEAFRQIGGRRLLDDLARVRETLDEVSRASMADDLKDDTGDGIADVDMLPPEELARRKVVVAMVAVTEPQTLMLSVNSLLGTYLAVLATLRFQFARTTALALGIAQALTRRPPRLPNPSLPTSALVLMMIKNCP